MLARGLPIRSAYAQLRLNGYPRARFLNGHPVRAVWSAIYDEKHQKWSSTRLYLASETHLTASEVVVLYSHRWQIEPKPQTLVGHQ